MIKGLTGTCGVTVSAGNTALPYVGTNTSNPMTGMLRIQNTDIEVFNGNSWQQISSTVLDVIQWARTQRQLDMNRKTLIENNPALQKAYEAVKRAEANFDILSKFVEHDEPGIVVGYNFNTP